MNDSPLPIPRRQAVALRYRQGQDASPRVVATGQGHLAEMILQKAKEAGIPLMEDPDLVNLLGKIPLGETIPMALYQAVAEVLAFIYRTNRHTPK
jgi:flagellar biosynthesis protein